MGWKNARAVVGDVPLRTCARAAAGARDSRAALPEQLAALHERYLDDVFRYVARRVARREEAEDITAEVFAAAFEGWASRRGADPYLWLLGIARRKIVDFVRRRKTRPETLASELPQEPGANALLDALAARRDQPQPASEQAEACRIMRALVDGLKEESREALLLKYVEGLPVNEIAVVLRRSPAAVNSLLQRARKTLFERGQGYFLNEEVSL